MDGSTNLSRAKGGHQPFPQLTAPPPKNGPVENHNSPTTTLPMHNSTAPDFTKQDPSGQPAPDMNWPPAPPLVNGFSGTEGYPKMNHFPQTELTKPNVGDRLGEGRRDPKEAGSDGPQVKKEPVEPMGIPVPAHPLHHHHPHAKYAYAAAAKQENAMTNPTSGKGPSYPVAPITASSKPTGSPSGFDEMKRDSFQH